MISRSIRLFSCAAAFVGLLLCPEIGMIRAVAVPARPSPIMLTQPNGKKLKAYIRGDEYQHWIETENGYSIVKESKSKSWQFAVKNSKGGLSPTGKVAAPGVAPPAGVVPHAAPNPTRPRANFGASGQIKPLGIQFGNWDPQSLTGTGKLIVIRVAFANRALVTAPDGWGSAVFSTADGAKSVANFYKDNSFDNFNLQPIAHTQDGNPAGIVSVTITKDHPNDHGNSVFSVEKAWINEALAAAAAYVDFPALDTSGNGVLENSEGIVYFIVAGYDASGSDKEPNIWAHAWGGQGVSAGGIRVMSWAMNGELNDDDLQHPMGAIAHELGHSMCNLPDLYDTSYTNSGLGIFSLMAAGSWGSTIDDMDPGSTPVSLDAWCRQYLGWSTPQVPTSVGQLSFVPALEEQDAPVKLIDPSVSTSQYFLAENRYPSGWDQGMEISLGPNLSGGLLIIHVDEAIGDPDANDINEYRSGSHQGIMAEEASTDDGSLLAGTSLGDVTHLFYSENNSLFDDLSTPDTKLYDGTSTFLGLGSISERAHTMTANFVSPNQVKTPYFSPGEGTYSSDVSVAISCDTPGAVIHYTTNGSTPTENDPIIQSGAPITFETTTTLKAMACKTDKDPSEVISATYTIVPPVVVYVKKSIAAGKVSNGKTWATAYTSIQKAINMALAGREVWVASGTYSERIALKKGLAIYGGFAGTETKRNQRNPAANVTIIDGGRLGSVVTAPRGADASTIIDGFTIRNGKATDGGGINCSYSSPTIRNNVISGNTALRHGGGIYFISSSPVIANNAIKSCTASDGGGIYSDSWSTALISSNLITGNSTKWGAGIFCAFSNPTIVNNTICGNTTTGDGGGIYCYVSTPTVKNNIIAFGTSGIFSYGWKDQSFSYNCVYGNTKYPVSPSSLTVGDTTHDPKFINRAGGNYRLQAGSPCIDAGDDTAVPPGSRDMDLGIRIQGAKVDIGAYEKVP